MHKPSASLNYSELLKSVDFYDHDPRWQHPEKAHEEELSEETRMMSRIFDVCLSPSVKLPIKVNGYYLKPYIYIICTDIYYLHDMMLPIYFYTKISSPVLDPRCKYCRFGLTFNTVLNSLLTRTESAY